MNSAIGDLALAEGAASPILGFFRSDETRALITGAFGRPGLGELILNEGGIDVAVKVMRRGSKPGLIIYDAGTSTNPVVDVATIIKHGGRALPVIVVGEAINTARFREFLSAGVFDYLDRSLGPLPLGDAIARARRERARRSTDAGPGRQGRLIVFAGTRGGVGTTSAAIATTWTLSHARQINTALLDLDLSSGTVAFALDIDPGRGLREGLDQPARIDAVFIERCLVRESPHLAVLSAEEPYDSGNDIDPASAVVLLDELKQAFDCIVVDLPRGNALLNRAVLAAADDIVLVTSPTLTGLRDALRWIEFAAVVADRAAIRVVQGPTFGPTPLPKAEFEKSLGRRIDITVPLDAKGAAAAANAGKSIPAIAPDGGVAAAFGALVDLLGFPAAETTLRKGFQWPWKDRVDQS